MSCSNSLQTITGNFTLAEIKLFQTGIGEIILIAHLTTALVDDKPVISYQFYHKDERLID